MTISGQATSPTVGGQERACTSVLDRRLHPVRAFNGAVACHSGWQWNIGSAEHEKGRNRPVPTGLDFVEINFTWLPLDGSIENPDRAVERYVACRIAIKSDRGVRA